MSKKRPRPNGFVLTAKYLDKRAYSVIHSLKRGYRRDAIAALLTAAADFADKNPEWYREAVAGNLRLSVAKAR